MTKSHSDKEIVTEEQVERALSFLRDSAGDFGHLTAAARMNEHLVKVQKAFAMKSSDAGSIAAKEVEALTSDEYFKALEDDAKAHAELAKHKALREAAALRIEVWRTQSSNFRSMKI